MNKNSKIVFSEISLLSEQEFKKYQNIIPRPNQSIKSVWWLQTHKKPKDLDMPMPFQGYPGSGKSFRNLLDEVRVTAVDSYGETYQFPVQWTGYVRPVLRIKESGNLKKGDTFSLLGLEWTALSSKLALCNDIIGKSPYRNKKEARLVDADEYDISDVNNYLTNWAKEHGLFQVISESEFEFDIKTGILNAFEKESPDLDDDLEPQ